MYKFFIFCIIMLNGFLSFCQYPNWQNLDLSKDGVFGISTERAYKEFLGNRKPQKVIVAIIDTGIDTAQEDLHPVIWTDPKSGCQGWNYIGSETGQEDLVKIIANKKDFFDSLAYTSVPENFRAGYQAYRKLLPQLDDKKAAIFDLVSKLEVMKAAADSIVLNMGIVNPAIEDFKRYSPANDKERSIVKSVLGRMRLYPTWKECRKTEFDDIIFKAKVHLKHGLNINNSELDTAKGDFDINPDKIGLLLEPNLIAYHGTHVAGIIGAVRNNGLGMNGIADKVQLMMLKVNGNIRELRDESLADAIRFAVDHGAKIINMSFGKPYTWDKKSVDDAVKYAMNKDVLFIHAAGNSGEDLDKVEHYPNPIYLDGGKAQAWIEVGASGYKNDSSLAASFSNYGKISVDVFAPGVEIYSTLPYNDYASWRGTSMAAPVVAGVAALIREYDPKFSATQVKDIILKSVVRSPYLADKCVAGGVVNAFNALELAFKIN